MPEFKPRNHTFESECIELFAGAAYALAVPKSVGQIYGLLYASEIPLSFKDIVDRLEISKGSASQGLHLLRSLGAINVAYPLNAQTGQLPSSETRGRTVSYEPELGLRCLISGILKEKIEPLIDEGEGRLASLRRIAKMAPDRSTRGFQIGRVKQIETWRRQVTLILPILKTLFAVPRL